MIDPIAIAWPPGHKLYDSLDWTVANTSKGVLFEDKRGIRYLYSQSMPTEHYPKNMKKIKK